MISNSKAERTIPLGDITCPKCGMIGQEKYRRNNYGQRWYRYVDHYQTYRRIGQKALHSKFIKSCYVGKI